MKRTGQLTIYKRDGPRIGRPDGWTIEQMQESKYFRTKENGIGE